MERVEKLLSEEEVDKRIADLGAQISKDYEGKSVHLICVLKGGAPFMCELAKRITVPVSMDFMSVSSYGGGTGRTLSHLIEIFKKRNPRSIRLCTLLDKPERRVVSDVNVEYVGFRIPDEFVVGYGLDYDQRYRNLPYIGVMKFD